MVLLSNHLDFFHLVLLVQEFLDEFFVLDISMV